MKRLSAFAKSVYRRFFVTSNRKILWQITDKLVLLHKDAAALSKELAAVERKNAETANLSRDKLQTNLSEVSAQIKEVSQAQHELNQSLQDKLTELDRRSEKKLAELCNTTEKHFSERGIQTEKHVSDFKAQSERHLAELKELMECQLRATLLNARTIERLQSSHQNCFLPYIKLSFIIPVFNGELYLTECLDSVVSQDFNNFEVLCVDDGSTDHSGEIIDEYAYKYPFVHAFHTTNQGLGAARNYGLRYAHGEFVSFVDSDDYLKKDVLRPLYEEASTRELDVLYFDGDTVYEDPALEQQYPQYKKGYSLSRSREYGEVTDGQSIYCAMRRNGDYREVVWLQMIRRAFLENTGLHFPEGMLHEDTVFNFACMTLAKRAAHRQIDAYTHRIRQNSLMTSPLTEKNVYSTFRCFLEFARLSLALSLTDETAQWAQKTLRNLRSLTLSRYKQSGVQIDSCNEYFNAASRALFKTMILDQKL